MSSILEPEEPVSVEFDGRHGRVVKTFPAAWLAKKFFVAKHRAGKHPKVIKLSKGARNGTD